MAIDYLEGFEQNAAGSSGGRFDGRSSLPFGSQNRASERTRAPSVSPYDFFADVIELPPAIDPRTGLSGGSVHFFAPSLLGRLTVTDLLSNGAALFVLPPLHPAM